MILSFLFACLPEESTIENTELASSDEIDFIEDTGTESGDDVLILNDGIWSVDIATVENDGCDAGQYQNLEEMVPEEMEISNGTMTSFRAENGNCFINGSEFSCDSQDVSESALGNTATLNISSTMFGTIHSENELELSFDVVMTSCDGIGCTAIEMIMEFPCTIELSSTAMY